MAKLFRAFFECEEEPNSNITMDIIVNEKRHLPGKVPFMGYWGRNQTNNVWPFIFQSGKLDFGNDPEEPSEDNDRYAHFKIEDRILAVGDVYVLNYYGCYRMRLNKLTDLLDHITA